MDKFETEDFVWSGWEYIAYNNIWGNETEIIVLVPKKYKKKDFAKQIDPINELCEWVDNNRKLIEDTLIEMDYVKQENYIDYYCGRKTDENGNYILPNGEKIMMPLSEEIFKQNLVMEKFAIYFRDGDPADEQNFQADLEHPVCNLLMSSEPYTCKLYMSLNLTSDKQLECHGTVG